MLFVNRKDIQQLQVIQSSRNHLAELIGDESRADLLAKQTAGLKSALQTEGTAALKELVKSQGGSLPTVAEPDYFDPRLAEAKAADPEAGWGAVSGAIAEADSNVESALQEVGEVEHAGDGADSECKSDDGLETILQDQEGVSSQNHGGNGSQLQKQISNVVDDMSCLVKQTSGAVKFGERWKVSAQSDADKALRRLKDMEEDLHFCNPFLSGLSPLYVPPSLPLFLCSSLPFVWLLPSFLSSLYTLPSFLPSVCILPSFLGSFPF